MIKPVEYQGQKLWVSFTWPKSRPNVGRCYLYALEGEKGNTERIILATAEVRRNPRDTPNRNVARDVAFGRMLKGAATLFPLPVVRALRENYENRGKG